MVKDGIDRYKIGPYMEILQDPEGNNTIDDILVPPLSETFVPVTATAINHGFSKAAYWVRFSVKNTRLEKISYLLEIGSPLIDNVDLYEYAAGGKVRVSRSGELVPFHQRAVPHRTPLFSIVLSPGEQQEYLIRFQDCGSVPFEPTLWEPSSFRRQAEKELYALGVYYGAMMIILLYNLIVYLMIRRKSYLTYVIYVSSYILWQMTYNGLSNVYLWPNHTWLTNHAIGFLICMTGIAALLFTITFLKTRKNTAKLHRYLVMLIVGFGVASLLSFQANNTVSILTSTLLATIFAPLVLITSLVCLRDNYRPAYYFSIAWFMLLCGTALLALKSLGVLPSNLITEHGQQVGSLFEILLLSVALADQVNIMKHEKELAQAETLRVQHEANLELENKVSQRTRELQETNTDLENLSDKLAKYLSPQVYRSIFSGKTDVKLQSYRKKLTVFFSDIKSFTEMTDSMEPEAVTSLLNYYLMEMSLIALKYGGTIDKFIGDAIMVFFGDPETEGEKEDAVSCVKMALEMREAMSRLQKEEQFAVLAKPFQVRMGINSGYCTVGNFGSESRLDYTIIGGQVNLASRLESLAEPNQILISHNTYNLVKDDISCEEKGEIQVRGIAH
ncbi:MAG: hypothetical protein KAJ60_01420, partial [Desulfobulbaceae bacterium]|nr:hypothetical protein [Desulfobulbaceae bacterium]